MTRNHYQVSQLEQIISNIPVETEAYAPNLVTGAYAESECVEQQYLRDVYFFPLRVNDSSQHDMGLDISQHGRVESVSLESPLYGRVFVGDVIISVNDIDLVGLEPHHVIQRIREATRSAIKLTVLSASRDLASDTDDGRTSSSIESGLPESGENEV